MIAILSCWGINRMTRVSNSGQDTEGRQARWPSGLIACALVLFAPFLVGCEQQISSSLPISPTVAESATSRAVTGRVIGVADGDTLTVLIDERRQLKVRLAEIDAPERGQPWGNRSRTALSEQVYGRDIVVHQTDVDRWGRVVGRVFVDERYVNREMVASGAAWAYRRYTNDRAMIDAEVEARRERRGLWSMPQSEIVAPWDWRLSRRRTETSRRSDETSTAGGVRPILSGLDGADVDCASKSRCHQMSSCDEAKRYFDQCRLKDLDGDSDGEPCEGLCGPTAG